MDKSNLRDIYDESNNYIEIETCDLQRDYVNPEDQLAINRLVLELRLQYIAMIAMILFFDCVVFFSFYGSIDSKSNLSIKKIFPILSVFILTLVPLLRVVNLLISTRKNSYKKAQYGVVNRKFSELKKKKKGGLKTYYYADVIFPSNNTIIRKVKCGVIVYNSIENGSRVLVISFDDRVTHIVAV